MNKKTIENIIHGRFQNDIIIPGWLWKGNFFPIGIIKMLIMNDGVWTTVKQVEYDSNC